MHFQPRAASPNAKEGYRGAVATRPRLSAEATRLVQQENGPAPHFSSFYIFLHLSSSILFLPALTTGLEGAQLLEDDTDEHLSLPHFLSPETFDIFRHLVAAHCDEDCSS